MSPSPPSDLPHLRLAALGPFVILAVAAWRLAAHWSDIPTRFPVHWSAGGVANGWATRSFWGVFGMLLLAAFVCAVLMILAQATLHWSASPHAASSPSQRRAAAWTCLGAAYLLALIFGIVAQLPLTPTPKRIVLPVIIAVPLLVAALLAFVWRAQSAPAAHPQRAHDNFWVGGLFYYNPYDPAVMVPKRFGLGYTFNFANRRSWWLLGLFAAVLVVIAATARN